MHTLPRSIYQLSLSDSKPYPEFLVLFNRGVGIFHRIQSRTKLIHGYTEFFFTFCSIYLREVDALSGRVKIQARYNISPCMYVCIYIYWAWNTYTSDVSYCITCIFIIPSPNYSVSSFHEHEHKILQFPLKFSPVASYLLYHYQASRNSYLWTTQSQFI